MARESTYFFTTGNFPQADAAIRTACDQVSAIWREGDPIHMFWSVVGEGDKCLSLLGIPYSSCAIITRCDHILTIRGKDRSVHQIGVPFKASQFFSTGNIPKSGCTICTCCEYLFAIRRENCSMNIASVPNQNL